MRINAGKSLEPIFANTSAYSGPQSVLSPTSVTAQKQDRCLRELRPPGSQFSVAAPDVNVPVSLMAIFIGRPDAEVEAPILWPPDSKN